MSENEIKALAQKLNEIINQGMDPIEYLRENGSTDPRGDWELARNWMKTWETTWYAAIPLKYRITIRK